MIRRVSARDRPERLEARAAENVARVRGALAMASKRAARSSPTVRALFASAVVEDVALKHGSKSTAIIFTAHPFRGGLHQVWGWHQLAKLTDSEVASWISRACGTAWPKRAGSSSNERSGNITLPRASPCYPGVTAERMGPSG